MFVLGVGNDLVNIKRIEKVFVKNKSKFIKKIFNPIENVPRNVSPEFIAKSFAAKEAFSKAIGTGIGKTIKFTDIIVSRNKLGAPKIKLSKSAQVKVNKKLNVKKTRYFISISDDYPFAFATVIITN
tara:strand:- start:141 stop:521 length:381 start_codon:yes stop_codon:yes gene_type:complete